MYCACVCVCVGAADRHDVGLPFATGTCTKIHSEYRSHAQNKQRKEERRTTPAGERWTQQPHSTSHHSNHTVWLLHSVAITQRGYHTYVAIALTSKGLLW